MLTRGQLLRGRTNLDRHLGKLLLALEGSGRFAATGSGLPGGLSQLFELALVGLADTGRLEGGLVVGVSVGHGVSPPSRRGCGSRKELTSLSGHAFVRSMVRVWYHLRHQAEKLAPRAKANEYNNTNYKKMQQYTRIIFISPLSEGHFRIVASPYNLLNSQKCLVGLMW